MSEGENMRTSVTGTDAASKALQRQNIKIEMQVGFDPLIDHSTDVA